MLESVNLDLDYVCSWRGCMKLAFLMFVFSFVGLKLLDFRILWSEILKVRLFHVISGSRLVNFLGFRDLVEFLLVKRSGCFLIYCFVVIGSGDKEARKSEGGKDRHQID